MQTKLASKAATKHNDKKTDRLLIRLSETDKRKIRVAARADARSISAFVLRAALLAAADGARP